MGSTHKRKQLEKDQGSSKYYDENNITGAYYLIKNKVILDSVNIRSLLHEAKRAAYLFYHKNTRSNFAHIRDIGKMPVPQITERRPRPIGFTKVNGRTPTEVYMMDKPDNIQ